MTTGAHILHCSNALSERYHKAIAWGTGDDILEMLHLSDPALLLCLSGHESDTLCQLHFQKPARLARNPPASRQPQPCNLRGVKFEFFFVLLEPVSFIPCTPLQSKLANMDTNANCTLSDRATASIEREQGKKQKVLRVQG